MDEQIHLAIIAGSGFYQMTGLDEITEFHPKTPFGRPSAPIKIGRLSGKRIAFLARHGEGHHILPSELNSRANIYSLKMLGVQRIIAVNACGSLREDFIPGHFVIPDQLFDHTHGRANTFFGDGMVAHVGVADPFCPKLSSLLEEAVRETHSTVHRGGTFITIEGPRFSTKAESQTYRSWGMSIVGMTSSPEAFLAKEAEMCYTIMAHVTDFDVWHVSEKPVSVEMVLSILNQNTKTAQDAIRFMLQKLPEARGCSCDSAMASAIITNPKVIPSETRKKLDLLIHKYIK